MTRHEERETAFIILFEKIFRSQETLDEIIESACDSEFFEADEFVKRLVRTAEGNAEKIDAAIEESLVGWTLKRISKVSLAVLRLAVCEILFFDDIPVGVSINEAVEITKKYSSAEDASFVNGVLGSVSKKSAK